LEKNEAGSRFQEPALGFHPCARVIGRARE